MTRRELREILDGLRLGERDRRRLAADLDLLRSVAGGGDNREITLGSRTSEALARVRAADREATDA